MIILGIETSCDDTAASVLQHGSILSNIIKSNSKILDTYGGVVPELSARMHERYIKEVVKQALNTADVKMQNVDAIAVTSGPGLMRSLLVGTTFAQTLAIVKQKPLIGINHLEGHILSGNIEHDIDFPFMCLLISGGHTMIVLAEKLGKYAILGQTVDDSAGEAFDKISQILKLSHIGGKIVEDYAQKGCANVFSLPSPMIHSGDLRFSFAGLKTATKRLVNKLSDLTEQQKCDICLAAQNAISNAIVKKIMLTHHQWRLKYGKDSMTLVTVGGVASNRKIRQDIQTLCQKNHINAVFPSLILCTDNAAMIANVAHMKILQDPSILNQTVNQKLKVKASPVWPVEQIHF